MSSPTRYPASKSILLVWILNIFLLGLGNVYASGLSALQYLVVGILIRIFVSHMGVLLGAWVLLSLIGTGEIFSVSGLAKKKPVKEIKPKYGKSRQAINAPSESLMSTYRVRHETPPENVDNLTDEFVRRHLQPEAAEDAETVITTPDYADIHAGQITYDALAADAHAQSLQAPIAIEPLSYDFEEYKFDALNYQTMGAQAVATADFTCPHCGAAGQNDFSFCLQCGHAYAIG